MNDEHLIDIILKARRPIDIFGPEVSSLKPIFHALSKKVHPDQSTDVRASDAFIKLKDYYELAITQIENDTYNKLPSILEINTSIHKYSVIDLRNTFKVVAAYNCLIDNIHPAIFSIAHSPKDGDLMDNEAKIVASLFNDSQAFGFFSMLPGIVETLGYEHEGYVQKVSIYEVPGEYCTLAEAIAAYPDGVSGQDMAWIYRRLLDILGYAHSKGIVHGAVTPDNILIGIGEEHNVKLINWQAAVNFETQKVQLLLDEEKYYAPEILNKEVVYPATDLYMLSKSIESFVDPELKSITGFLNSCCFANIQSRPQNAWKLRKEFTNLIEKMWGERKYKPFYLPTK